MCWLYTPAARWRKQNKTGRFNLRSFYSSVLSTSSPSGCFPFLPPPHLSSAGVRGQRGDKASETGSCVRDYLTVRSSHQPAPSWLPGPAWKDELQRESSLEKLRPPFWWNQSQSRRRKDANVAVSPSFTLASDGFSPNKRP